MRKSLILLSMLAVVLTVGLARADAPAEAPATEPAAPPAAADVQQQMLEQLQKNEPIEPTIRPSDRGAAAPAVEVDRRVIGAAPAGLTGSAPSAGDAPANLVRDGQFIISRRGRVISSTAGTHVLFAFDADAEKSPEPPMILLPCQMLQNMEEIVAERGDQVVFILSGQVYAYRGANYLLPTMMKLAIDKGNLEP